MMRSELPAYANPHADRDERFKQAIKWSLILHSFLLISIVTKEAFFPSTPTLYTPSLRVDLVALPDHLKKEILSNSSLPSKDKESKTAAAIKKLKTLSQTPPAETAAPGEMAMKPAASTGERKKKIQGALARIKALAKLTDEVKETTKAPVKGNILSKGTSLSGNAKESAMSNYYEEVVDQVRRYWELPVWLARKNLAAQVRVSIDIRGKVVQLVFIKSSGNAQFDEAAKQSILSAEPFPMPPSEVRTTVMSAGMVLGFPL